MSFRTRIALIPWQWGALALALMAAWTMSLSVRWQASDSVSETRLSQQHQAAAAASQARAVVDDHARVAQAAWQTPAADSTRHWLPDLAFLATQHAVVLRRVEPGAPEAALPVLAVQGQSLRVQVSGHYPDVKAWLSDVLVRHPTLALRSLALQRRAGDAGQVDAQLVFAHWAPRG